MMELGLLYVASARDIRTPITADARASMSGLAGMSLIYPELLYQDPEAKRGRRLVHFTSNFQATSPRTRAFEIAEAGGLIAVKAHIVKTALGFVQVDGLDELYRNYLDALFAELAARYGESLWWTSMGEIAARLQAS